MARVTVVKKDGKPVAAKVTSVRRGPRNGTGPRARAGLCSGIDALSQITSKGK